MTVPPLIPAPTTSTAVDVDLIDDIRDLLEWLRKPPVASTYGTQQVTLGSGTSWDTPGSAASWEDRFNNNTDEIGSLSTGVLRLTRGIWRFAATVSLFTGTATSGGCQIALRNLNTGDRWMMGSATPTGDAAMACVASGALPADNNLAEADFRLEMRQSTGGDVLVSVHQFSCEFVSVT
ncbi:MAG: hypothetical protein GY708_20630 [Actinomycetia bacterium]|nr:hypothetical protein [Actinomycetes bacterium]